MEDKNNAGMKEQRMRRQRISRIRNGIMMSVGIWMLLSFIFCIGLTIQMIRLDRKIDEIGMNAVTAQQMADQMKDYKGNAKESDMQSYNLKEGADSLEAVEEEGETSAGALGAMNQDNMAKEHVPQKVYLTFDDGPSENTSKILDILKEKDVKATFFVTGNEDESAKELYQRIVAEGHTLGMHSYSHKYSVIYSSLEAFQDDFNQLRTYLTEITGVEPEIMRFPGGSSNQVSNIDMREFIRFLTEEEISYYDWNVASGDATSQAYTPDELVENVMKDVVKYDTSIVLMHDASTKGTTVEALGPMIDQLKALDVELLPIDENTKLIQQIPVDSITE